jgi:hypothetical protein
MSSAKKSEKIDILRQVLVLIVSPLIWVFSSLGIFMNGARSPKAFSDLTENLLVPQSIAFSIWLPIFLGIMAYGIVQAFRSNRSRAVFRESGWWMAAGLWGVALWGLVTAFASDKLVEILASLIFVPTMICLVVAMVKTWNRRDSLCKIEKWLVLVPISLIAGWCSIAVFVGLNGLVWKMMQGLAWSITGPALAVLGAALTWIIYVLRRQAQNRIYTIPIVWGLGFLALRSFVQTEAVWIGLAAIAGIIAVSLAAFIPTKLTAA